MYPACVLLSVAASDVSGKAIGRAVERLREGFAGNSEYPTKVITPDKFVVRWDWSTMLSLFTDLETQESSSIEGPRIRGPVQG